MFVKWKWNKEINQSNRRSWKQNNDSAHDSVAYYQVKTALLESQAEVEE